MIGAMPAFTLLRDGDLRVFDSRCTAGPRDRPYPEVHSGFSLAYVRRGSFGYVTCGRRYELVAGAFMVGRPGDEYTCTHEHHERGDECLSFQFREDWLEAQGLDARGWASRALPVLAPLAVLGERAQAAAEGRPGSDFEESAVLLAARLLDLQGAAGAGRLRVSARDRRRAVRSALWLEAHADQQVSLGDAARIGGVSGFHFLRLFARVTGVTPHQYLVRARLRRAARLLAQAEQPIGELAYACGFNDLSNFVRTFRRASGLAPGAFRAATRKDRNFLQAAGRAASLT